MAACGAWRSHSRCLDELAVGRGGAAAAALALCWVRPQAWTFALQVGCGVHPHARHPLPPVWAPPAAPVVQTDYRRHLAPPPLRPASAQEGAPYLQQPRFSTCTIPVLLAVTWRNNLFHVLGKWASEGGEAMRNAVLPALLHRGMCCWLPPGRGNLAPVLCPCRSDNAAVWHAMARRTPWQQHLKPVMLTPDGIALTSIEAGVLPALGPLSLQSFADFSARLPPGTAPGVQFGGSVQVGQEGPGGRQGRGRRGCESRLCEGLVQEAGKRLGGQQMVIEERRSWAAAGWTARGVPACLLRTPVLPAPLYCLPQPTSFEGGEQRCFRDLFLCGAPGSGSALCRASACQCVCRVLKDCKGVLNRLRRVRVSVFQEPDFLVGKRHSVAWQLLVDSTILLVSD